MKKKFLLTITTFCVALIHAQNAPLVLVNIQDAQMVCNPGDCTVLNVENQFIPRNTDTYTVASIDYNPIFPFSGGVTIPPNGDDYWSPVFDLPFGFCFYGNTYNSVLVGTNGVITFDLAHNNPMDFCEYSFNQTIPNVDFPIKNAIYGVYQDTDIRTPPITNPSFQNINYYVVDTGVYAAPNRAFIVNFNQLPQYDCGVNVGFQTSQIVIHEGTNIVEVFVKNRTSCTSWNNGSGLIGLQNQSGTSAIAPTDRNTGSWSATDEAWRFTPNGASLPITYQWYVDGFVVPGATSESFVVCPTSNQTMYSVQATFENCGNSFVLNDQNDYDLLSVYPLANPVDISICSNDTGFYTIDIDQAAYVLNGANPADYDFKFYENLIDAELGTNNFITSVNNFSFTQNQTIYLVVEDLMSSGCRWIKSFALNINPAVAPPTGAANQGFNPGQTLNDLVVEGENIQWYDAAIGGNLLPGNTLLQNNFTYYASQTVNNCESRMLNPVRLAVRVYDVTMSNNNFFKGNFKVYPNPTHQFLTITNSCQMDQVIVRNSLGQKVLEVYPNQKEYTLNMTQLLSGIYMLDVKSEKQSQTLKVVKN